MPLSLEAKVDLDRAVKAYVSSSQALQDFQQACQRRDWDKVELARTTALCSLESFMDNFAMAYRT